MSSSFTVIATSQVAAFALSGRGLIEMPLPPPPIVCDSHDADSYYDLGYGDGSNGLHLVRIVAITIVLVLAV
jgi:hypothetical protein